MRFITGSGTLVAILAAVAVSSAQAQVLLSDDFNDNSLDASKWTVALPYGGSSSVVEQNQRVQFTARGYLTTVNNFNPLTTGLHISGRWTFQSLSDVDAFQVLTRSDGVPNLGSSGETQNGIEFAVWAGSGGGIEGIQIYGRGAAVTGATVVNNTLDISNGDSVLFDIIDDGLNLSFTMTEIGNPSSTATITAQSSSSMPANKIVFHNRELFDNIAYLDDVTITAVPEPSTLGLAAMVGLGVLACRRKK